MKSSGLERLYEDLARFQWWRRRLSGARGGLGLDMHKRLCLEEGGHLNLNAWLWDRVGEPAPGQVLDLGAGFGATLLEGASRLPEARFVGLSLSPYQVARARGLARQRGLAQRVTFDVGDNACHAFEAGAFDLVVSIETLFHAVNLERTLAQVCGHLRPDGRLILVEDMLVEPGAAASLAGRELSERWSTPTLHTAQDYRDALARTGFEIVTEHDLSAGVMYRTPAELEVRRRRLRRWRRWAPLASVRSVLEAFLGGLALEELHAAGAMGYHAWIVRRVPASAPGGEVGA